MRKWFYRNHIHLSDLHIKMDFPERIHKNCEDLKKQHGRGWEWTFRHWQERTQCEYEQAGAFASSPNVTAAVMWRDVMRCCAVLCAPTVGQGVLRGYITLDFRGTQLLPPSISPSLSRSMCLCWVQRSGAGTDGRQGSPHRHHRRAREGGAGVEG